MTDIPSSSVRKSIEVNFPNTLSLNDMKTKNLLCDCLGNASNSVQDEEIAHHHLDRSRGVIGEVDIFDLAT